MKTIYDRIRAAWNPDSPQGLHQIAEELASEGYDETAIYDGLEKLLLEERESGADDAIEDRITDVMERLTGWCHESGHIHTNPTAAPTIDDIARLPRWARVAFAARCARRATPTMFEHWPTILHPELPPSDTPAHVMKAIEAAECAASKAMKPTSDIHRALYPIVTSKFFGNRSAGIVARVVLSAAQAIGAAESDVPVGRTDHLYQADGGYTDVPLAFEAVFHSVPTPLSSETNIEYIASIRRDMEIIRTYCDHLECDDDTPVPPEVFGPLWPEGPPKGWPADPTIPSRTELPFTLWIGEDTSDDVVKAEMSLLFDVFNRYYIARAGDRLTPEGDIYTSVAVLNPIGVS